VYIDGREGTTGLQIMDRLKNRDDIELMLIDEAKRKDIDERRKFLNSADLVFLCLPDDAAKEAVGLIEDSSVRVIDASTAHRTALGWIYGFPELSQTTREDIANSKRVANPGCHASGFIAAVYPLRMRGIAPVDIELSCLSLTGYSGGGKKLIAEYKDEARDPRHKSDRIYGLELKHKHLREMKWVCAIERTPVFVPVVGDYYNGMATVVTMPYLDAQKVYECLAEHYSDAELVSVAPFGGDEPVIYSNTLAGHDSMRLIVSGHENQTIVTALSDNLGKGAAGSAVQNMNIMLGFDELTGLKP